MSQNFQISWKNLINLHINLKTLLRNFFVKIKDKAPKTSFVKAFTREVARQSYDPDMEVDGFEDYLDDAFYYRNEYDTNWVIWWITTGSKRRPNWSVGVL